MENLYKDYKIIWHCFNPSLELDNMINTIKNFLKGYQYSIDKYNNIFIGDFSKNRPCLIAHLDSVHNRKSTKILFKNNILKANHGIGGDDKCGIVAILEILKQNKNVNAIFCSDEEIGGIGASKIKSKILKNVSYFIEIDRGGKNDVIYESGYNKIASDDFIHALKPYVKKYNFKEDFGTFTDVNILTGIAKKSAINVSCGYYKAHTKNEYVNLDHLYHTINFVNKIINNIREVYIWEDKQEYNIDECEDYYKDDTLEHILEKAYYLNYDDDIIKLICKAYDVGYWESHSEIIKMNKRGSKRNKLHTRY